MQAADGELYVIGIVESDGWANDAEEEEDQIEYWKYTEFDGCEWLEFKCGSLYED